MGVLVPVRPYSLGPPVATHKALVEPLPITIEPDTTDPSGAPEVLLQSEPAPTHADQHLTEIYTRIILMRRTRFPCDDPPLPELTDKVFSMDKGTIQLHPPKLKRDWIGPVHPITNLHPVVFSAPENETALERRYREKKETVQRWSQEYWYQHNMIHRIERDAFVQRRLKEKYPDGNVKCSTLNGDEMADFFKQFSDSMHKVHAEYSQLWYRNNIEILGLAVLVWCQRVWRRVKLV